MSEVDTAELKTNNPEASGEQRAPEKLEEYQKQIASLEEENKLLKDQALRSLAEAENTRRRAKLDCEEAGKYGTARLVKDLLSVADNLNRALDHIPDTTQEEHEHLKGIREGVEMTEKELFSVLEKNNVVKIDPLNEKFDHNFHQALFEKEDADHPEGTIIEVLQVGYSLHDRLLRPALVSVSKGKKEA